MDARPDRASWIKGGSARCDPPVKPPRRPVRLVLLGAPGVGKGTQAELLSGRLGACQLSTGDMFRAARKLKACDRSPALEAAFAYMKRGELVPDFTVLELLHERAECLRCGGGFLLDGFPRTLTQAFALEGMLAKAGLALDAVLSYEMPIEEIVTRLGGRRTCPDCRAVYHVESRRPRVVGVCDQCGGTLFQRDDDRPEAIRVRMQVYEESTTPLVDYYRRKELLRQIPAQGAPEEIFDRTLAALG
jgi:adenylate kinase